MSSVNGSPKQIRSPDPTYLIMHTILFGACAGTTYFAINDPDHVPRWAPAIPFGATALWLAKGFWNSRTAYIVQLIVKKGDVEEGTGSTNCDETTPIYTPQQKRVLLDGPEVVARVKDAEQALNSVHSKALAEIQSKFEAAKNEVEKLRFFESQVGQISELEKAKVAAESEATKLRQQQSANASILAANKQRIADLEREIAKAKEQIISLQTEIDQAKIASGNAVEKLQEQQSANSKITTELREQLTSLQTQLEQAKSKLETTENELQQERSTSSEIITKLREEVATLQAQLEQAKSTAGITDEERFLFDAIAAAFTDALASFSAIDTKALTENGEVSSEDSTAGETPHAAEAWKLYNLAQEFGLKLNAYIQSKDEFSKAISKALGISADNPIESVKAEQLSTAIQQPEVKKTYDRFITSSPTKPASPQSPLVLQRRPKSSAPLTPTQHAAAATSSPSVVSLATPPPAIPKQDSPAKKNLIPVFLAEKPNSQKQA